MRLLVLAVFAAISLTAPGCRSPEPFPRHALIVGPYGYVLDGTPMAQDQAMSELGRLAEASRRATGGVRFILEVRSEAGVPYNRVTELLDQCVGLGITKIERP